MRICLFRPIFATSPGVGTTQSLFTSFVYPHFCVYRVHSSMQALTRKSSWLLVKTVSILSKAKGEVFVYCNSSLQEEYVAEVMPIGTILRAKTSKFSSPTEEKIENSRVPQCSRQTCLSGTWNFEFLYMNDFCYILLHPRLVPKYPSKPKTYVGYSKHTSRIRARNAGVSKS